MNIILSSSCLRSKSDYNGGDEGLRGEGVKEMVSKSCFLREAFLEGMPSSKEKDDTQYLYFANTKYVYFAKLSHS